MKRQIKQSPKLPAEARRQQLLMAAHNLFDKKGYRATTLDDIATEVGLTKGAVYHHFRNKEAILLELTQMILNLYQDGVGKLPRGSLQPGELIRRLKKIDGEAPMHGARHNLSLLAEIIQIPRIRRAIDDGYEEFLGLCTRCLDPTLATSRKGLWQLALLTVNFYDGLCWGSFMHPNHIDFDKQARLFTKHFDAGKPGKARNRRGK
ncbi:MAG: TetR/AcrR family transcriptional regulator [candidate division Zixibacteria bacterium]|nr:TetR/AcrR family transcriptional regulator [candidate division Zixibacteria bacterium]